MSETNDISQVFLGVCKDLTAAKVQFLKKPPQ